MSIERCVMSLQHTHRSQSKKVASYRLTDGEKDLV